MRVTLTVEVNVDPTGYGFMSRASVHEDVQRVLDSQIPHYHPKVVLPHLRAEPTLEATLEAVRTLEPCTADEVHSRLGLKWGARTTVRNRLNELAKKEQIICHREVRPMKFTLNKPVGEDSGTQ